MSSARDYILGKGRSALHLLPVPIGEFTYFAIRRSSTEVAEFRRSMRLPGSDDSDPEKMQHFTERKVIFGIVDAEGVPLFTEADLPLLVDKGFNVEIEYLAAAVTLQNFLDAAAVEELKKTLHPVPPSGSATNSPGSSPAGTSTNSSPKSPNGTTKGG
ncbi:MAG: hypothetical protein ACKVT0_14700 [Planctomycetaceae bacterium]